MVSVYDDSAPPYIEYDHGSMIHISRVVILATQDDDLSDSSNFEIMIYDDTGLVVSACTTAPIDYESKYFDIICNEGSSVYG